MTLFFISDIPKNFQKAGLERIIGNFLFAVNYIDPNGEMYIESLITLGKNILIDSGIFALASDFSREKNIPLSEAFTYDPEKIDGFGNLFDEYVRLVKKFGPSLWGYIELDLGGQESKKNIRSQLENLGLNPIPVYHPLSDEEGYFDFLCERYNRIAVGNLAMSSPSLRNKILWSIDQRRKKYPDLWIHYLGVSLTPNCFPFQIDSCDSSEPSMPVRFANLSTKVLLKNLGRLDKSYFIDDQNYDRAKVYKVSGYDYKSNMTNCDSYQRELNEYQ